MLRRRLLCTAAAAPKPKDNRPWFIRNWGTSLFITVVSTWGYTLWVSNKARKASDAMEDAVKERMPANNDELIELRALNDAPNEANASLPSRVGKPRAGGSKVIQALRGAVAGPGAQPQPLKEEYVLERIFMALPDRNPEDGTADVRLATSAFAFLSTGTVRERIGTIYETLGADGGVPVSQLAPLLHTLMATGQVPPEKFVRVADEGKNILGIERSWYQVPPVDEHTPEGWAAGLLEDHYGVAPAAEGEAPSAGMPDRIDFENFVLMLQSRRVCLWGECFQIAERQRLQKLKDDADELVRNPPWYRRAWNGAQSAVHQLLGRA